MRLTRVTASRHRAAVIVWLLVAVMQAVSLLPYGVDSAGIPTTSAPSPPHQGAVGTTASGEPARIGGGTVAGQQPSVPPRGGQAIASFRIEAADLITQSEAAVLLRAQSRHPMHLDADQATAVDAFLRQQAPSSSGRRDTGPAPPHSLPDSARELLVEPGACILVRTVLRVVDANETTGTTQHATLELQAVFRQGGLRRMYFVVSDDATPKPASAIVALPRDPPLNANAIAGSSVDAGRLLSRGASELKITLYLEPVHTSPAVARVDLSHQLKPARYNVKMRNSTFGSEFFVLVSENNKQQPSSKSFSWIVRRGMRMPDFAAAIYNEGGTMLSSAAVSTPSARGVTFTDFLPDAVSTRMLRIVPDADPNSTSSTPTPYGKPRASVESLPTYEQQQRAHRQGTAGGASQRVYLAADFLERYREHFGSLAITDVQDDVVDILFENRGEARAFRVPLVPRHIPDGLHVAPGKQADEDPTVLVRFTASTQSGTRLRKISVTVASSIAMADLQVAIIDGLGVVLFSADDDVTADAAPAPSAAAGTAPPSSAHDGGIRGSDGDGFFTRTWDDALTAPADGWGGDRLRITVRVNAAPSSEDAMKKTYADPVPLSQQGSESDTSRTFAQAVESLNGALAAAGCRMPQVRFSITDSADATPSPAGTSNGVLSLVTTAQLPPSTMAAVAPARSMLVSSTTLERLPALRRLMRSREWLEVLEANKLPAEPHSSVFALTVGAVVSASSSSAQVAGGGVITANAAFIALWGTPTAQEHATDRFPTLWPAEEVGDLLRVSDGSWSAAGHEVDLTTEHWRNEFELLRRVTNFNFSWPTFRYWRTVVSASACILGGTATQPEVGVSPFALSLPHGDDSPAVAVRLAREDAAPASEQQHHQLALVTERAIAAGERLSVDLTAAGAVSDAEAFSRFGATLVPGVDAARAALVNGTLVRATRAGAMTLVKAFSGSAKQALLMVAARRSAVRSDVEQRAAAASETGKRRAIRRVLRNELAALDRLSDILDEVIAQSRDDGSRGEGEL